MSNIVIECRNKEAQNSIQNGDWTTVLPENIMLNPRDQVLIKSSFIDTQQSSTSKILIEEDINLKIDFGFYQVNYTNTPVWYVDYNTGNQIVTGQDLENRVLTYEQAGGGNLVMVTEYSLISSKEGSREATILFETRDGEGNPQNFEITIPPLGVNYAYEINELLGKLIDSTFGIQPNIVLEEYGLKLNSFHTGATDGLKVMLPHIETKEIKLPKGNYDPDELVEYINKEFNQNESPGDSVFITQADALLQESRHIQSRYHTGGNNTRDFTLSKVVGTDLPYKIKIMEDYPTIADTDNDLFFGASQFEISFSQATKTYSIDYIHTPHYYQGNAVVEFTESSLNTGQFTWVNKSGGIWIDRLYATTDSTGKPFDFWEGVLKFDVNSIQTKFTYADYSDATAGEMLIPQTSNLEDGKGTTGGLVTNDSALKKDYVIGTEGDLSGFAVPSSDQIGDGLFSSTDVTTTAGITGLSAIDNIDSFGYYLIEVKSQFKNDFLTPNNNFRAISQVVSRYYEVNSYTSGESGQIIYEHSGEPMLLQSFHCRILQSDKTVPKFIGDDNTIHIQIIKAPPETEKNE